MEYYIYFIIVTASDESETYYITIYGDKTPLTAIYDKLEAGRMKGLTKEFTITNTKIESEPNTQYPFIVVTGENDTVVLE